MSEGLIQLKSKDVPIIRGLLLKEQNGQCPICSKKITDPVLDHDHKKRIKGTGRVRAVLCRTCNVFIAKSENNSVRYGIKKEDLPNILRAVADYFEAPQTKYIHPSEAPKTPVLTKSSYNKLAKAYNGKAKFPEYRTKGNKKAQTLTKPLAKLFKQYNITPTFYK